MRKTLLILLSLASLVACVDNDMFKDIHVKPNVTLPIGTAIIADTTLFRLAGLEGDVTKDADGVLFFAVNGENKLITPNNINQIFELQPQNLAFDLALPTPTAPGQDVLLDGFAASAVMSMKLGQRVDELRLQSGTVELNIVSPGDFSNVICTIPEITKNGTAISVRINQPVILDESYVIKPKYSVGGKINYLMLNFSGTAPYVQRFHGSVSVISSGVAYVEGFLGNESVAISSSVIEPADDNFFEFTSQAKSAYFANPSIEISLNSTVNIPVMLRVIKLEVDNTEVPLKSAYNCDRFLIKAQEQTPTFHIDNSLTTTGTGFSDAITKDFKNIKITVEAVINPTPEDLKFKEYVPQFINSFAKEDVIELAYSVVLPFDCNLQGVKFVHSIDIDLADIAQNPDQKLDELAMMLGGYNQLPMTLEINPFVAQGNNPDAVRTYLFKEPFVIQGTGSDLKPSNLGFEPFTIEKGQSFVIEKSKIDKMLVSGKLFLDIQASTSSSKTNTGTVKTPTRKFYSPCELGLEIVLGAKADINLTPSK